MLNNEAYYSVKSFKGGGGVITADDVRAHLNLVEADDKLMANVVEGATSHLENLTGLSFSDMVWGLNVRCDEAGRIPARIRPLKAPVAGITGAMLKRDGQWEAAEISSQVYGDMNRVVIDLLDERHQCYREPVYADEFQVDIECSYRRLPMRPAALKSAALLIAGSLYEMREAEAPHSFSTNPALERLIAHYRV